MKVVGSKDQTDAMEALISCTHIFDGVTESWVPIANPDQKTDTQIKRSEYGAKMDLSMEQWEEVRAKRRIYAEKLGLTADQRRWLRDRGIDFGE